MIGIGPYREVYESHRKSFLQKGYSKSEAAAFAQKICARLLPESALDHAAGYLQSAIPNVIVLLECDHYEGMSLKVQEVVQSSADLFRDADDPKYVTAIASLGYPSDPGLAVVKVQETARSFRTITLKATCRGVRVRTTSMKLPSAGRAA